MPSSDDASVLAQQLRPLLKERADNHGFLHVFSKFNQHNYFKDREKVANARDAMEYAESRAVRLLSGISPGTLEALEQILLPMLVEDEVDPKGLLSSKHSIIAEIGASLSGFKGGS